jgi:hypothetical protein
MLQKLGRMSEKVICTSVLQLAGILDYSENLVPTFNLDTSSFSGTNSPFKPNVFSEKVVIEMVALQNREFHTLDASHCFLSHSVVSRDAWRTSNACPLSHIQELP